MTENPVPVTAAPYLQQTQVWTDVHGNTHLLEDMTANYLRNVLSYLEHKADELYGAEQEEVVRAQLVEVFEPCRYPHGVPPLEFATAREWLQSTPLVKAMTELLGERPARH
ncbi:hypothetical protein [Pseudarthrobacter chlorophenolicus]|nr:hypothetical protein [Pseudarthrobacter chlorophenolicus]